ncbi:MAG: BamA/OMP85 family outer membrane protein [Gemmatimonadaceae bacterium]
MAPAPSGWTTRSARVAVLRALCAAAAATGAVPTAGIAQDIACDTGATEVWGLHFRGNRTFDDAQLANGINSEASSAFRRWFRFFGESRCLDKVELTRDSLRILVHYIKHGFPQVKVATDIRELSGDRVDITFVIDEGEPLLVDSVTIEGADSLRAGDRTRVLRGFPLEAGDRFDQVVIDAVRDTLERRLRNNGYAMAEVLRSFETDTIANRNAVTYQLLPGARVRIDSVEVKIDPSAPDEPQRVDPAQVRRVVGIAEGDLYRARDLDAARRSLYLTDAFRHVDIALDSTTLGSPGDSTARLVVTLAENPLTFTRISGGWATLDCFRTQATYTNLNTFDRLQRLELNARVSKIGNGEPLRFARAFCPQLERDPFSDTLNYYVSATLSQAALFGLRSIPALTVFSERRSEYQTFMRTVPIGIAATLQYLPASRYPVAFGYQVERGRTEAQPALFCALFSVCEEDARSTLRELRWQAVASAVVTRNRVDNIANPVNGSVARLELRHASRAIGSDERIQFSRGVFDAAIYRRLSFAVVLAARVRLGSVIGPRVRVNGEERRAFIPPQERLYAGGASTVRGFQQNELGPVIYRIRIDPDSIPRVVEGGDTYLRVDSSARVERIEPLGGDNVVVGSLELRLRSPVLARYVQYAVFADAGAVWNARREQFREGFPGFSVTPGVGLRLYTPVGPIRLDVGYNPYDRPAGAAFVLGGRAGGEQPLFCVSPGNRLPITERPELPPEQAEGPCPATFAPNVHRSFFRRLTFQLAIGQAF